MYANNYALRRRPRRTSSRRTLVHRRGGARWRISFRSRCGALRLRKVVILIPVKNLSTAKQRLAAVLDQGARTELAQAMLHDVVSALAAWTRRPACALVTSDLFAMELARKYDFEIIPDPANPGETGAIEMATQVCVERGVDSTIVIPADIPLIQASELDQRTGSDFRTRP